MPHRVVILGGGFGGLYAARALRDKSQVHVTLIDKRNFHLFQPLLYQVATGALSPGDIAAPLRSVFRNSANVQVILAEARDFDITGRRVILDEGDVPYDTLIVATGADNFYFGNNQWEEFAPGLKSIEDATRMRHKILYAFEAAEREPDPVARRTWLTFVVVGAGPTGVELAGTLGEIANDVLKDDFRSIHPEEARILLLDGSPRVLPPFPPDLSAKAEKQLIALGVRSRNNVRVTRIDTNGVTIHTDHGEERIDSHTVLWAAGVRATSIVKTLADRTGVQVDKGGRITCEKDCSVPGHPNVFVIGDVADFRDENGNSLPGVAPVAMQQGSYVADAIVHSLEGKQVKPFHYFDKGTLAVIGRKAAVAKLGNLHFSGLFAWLLWLFIHLMYLVSFQNRLIVFIRWGFSYLTYNRGARLITGKEPTEDEKRLCRLLAQR
jgi:NADH dehydrogenase